MPVPDPNDPEFYWAAGFLEGEGSFIFVKSDGSIRVTAGQKYREPLERLRRVIGGAIYGPGKAGFYRWDCRGKFAEREQLMRRLYPLMSSRRQEQIDVALAKHATYPGSDAQREYNAKRAKRARERYGSDVEYRLRRRADHEAWVMRRSA